MAKEGLRDALATRGLAVMSLLVDRLNFGRGGQAGMTYGGKRDVYATLGYPTNLVYRDFADMYRRQDIASRIVDAPAQATWRKEPEIHEERAEGQSQNPTAFEVAWKKLNKKHSIFAVLERLDKMAGIGHYATLLFGFTDSEDMVVPVQEGGLKEEGVNGLAFIEPYSEECSEINEWDVSSTSPRFGLPNVYRIDPLRIGRTAGASIPVGLHQLNVHHTRIIHVAEGLLEDRVFGRSRLEAIFNRMQDMEKVVGGSAEIFWRAGWGGIHADVKEGYSMSSTDEAAFQDEIEEYVHGLSRIVKTRGIDIKRIQDAQIDPRPIASTLIDLISGATGIPQRILTGSERGEMASTQDESNWNNRVGERQKSFATLSVLKPFVDTLIYAGVLPKPRLGYCIDWPELVELSPKDQSDVAQNTGQAIKFFEEGRAAAGGNAIATPEEFRTKILRLPAVPLTGPLKAPVYPKPVASVPAKPGSKKEPAPAEDDKE